MCAAQNTQAWGREHPAHHLHHPTMNKESRSMSTDANKALVRQWMEAIDQADPAVVARYIAPDYVDHNPPPFPGLPSGSEGVRQAFELALAVFTDYRHEIGTQVAEGDLVVTQITGWGRHTGDFLGIPPTGREVKMSGISIHRVANGKLVEHWGQIDAFGLFQQLGAMPALAHP
jgi:predicted ester cyclase